MAPQKDLFAQKLKINRLTVEIYSSALSCLVTSLKTGLQISIKTIFYSAQHKFLSATNMKTLQ